MKIAILGTGLMGLAVAEGMIKAGHDVIVYNRTESRAKPLVDMGATFVSSATDAIKMSDASIMVLTDGTAVRSLLLNEEMLVAVNGKKLLNASTTGIEEILEFADKVAKQGGNLAEISIMVGPEEVRMKQGYFMLGCDNAEEAFWTELLSGLGDVQRVGNVSDATKAETPIVFASVFSSVMTAYAGASLIKLNIPADVAMNTIGAMIPGADYLLPKLMNRNYDECMASTDSLIGVADAAISTADRLGLPSKILADMKELYVEASKQGYGSKDASSIVEILINSK